MRAERGWVVRGAATYELAVGVVLAVIGVRATQWWTGVVGLGMIALGLGTGLGRGEGTSWMRGDLDERRRLAVDHAFRVAFFVLAWWVAGVAMYASAHAVPVTVWAAGNGVAVVAAYVDFALVLRRT